MSPSAIPHSTASDHFKDNLNLSILGLGVEYPLVRNGPEGLEIIANRHYPDSASLKKVLSINRFTGIEFRSTIATIDHPLVNQPSPPTITQLNTVFRKEGVRLSVNACRKAIAEWGGNIDEITHVVSTTCTNSANPGFDHYVCKELGIRSNVEKVLLHGVGCSGGLAAIRTAANLALGLSFRDKPARILVLACEISSLLVRSELDSIHENQEVRIGVCLFGDCASSCILSNGIGVSSSTVPVYDLLGWKHDVLEDTEKDLGFDVDPMGWKVILSPRVPSLAAASVSPAFHDLVNSLPRFHKDSLPSKAEDFDWALHPGGLTVITGVQEAMNLTPEHLRSSYEVYVEHGNSSSATIMSVLNNLRSQPDGKENVVACAFGPGIILEMMIMKRPSLANGDSVENGHTAVNGTNGHTNDVQAPANGHTNGSGQPATNGGSTENGTDDPPTTNGHSTENGNVSQTSGRGHFTLIYDHPNISGFSTENGNNGQLITNGHSTENGTDGQPPLNGHTTLKGN